MYVGHHHDHLFELRIQIYELWLTLPVSKGKIRSRKIGNGIDLTYHIQKSPRVTIDCFGELIGGPRSFAILVHVLQHFHILLRFKDFSLVAIVIWTGIWFKEKGQEVLARNGRTILKQIDIGARENTKYNDIYTVMTG